MKSRVKVAKIDDEITELLDSRDTGAKLARFEDWAVTSNPAEVAYVLEELRGNRDNRKIRKDALRILPGLSRTHGVSSRHDKAKKSPK